MNREEAYRLLVNELGAYAALGHSSLCALIGHTFEHRARGDDGIEYMVEVSVRGGPVEADRILVEGTIDSPSPFRMERLEETIVVTAETQEAAEK